MKKSFPIFFIVLIFTVQANCAELPGENNSKDISVYSKRLLKVFTPDEGLPQSSIMSMAIDKEGYLWIGTQDGAAYYDGRNWNIVNLPNRTISNYVQTIFVAKDSAIWFSADRGEVHRLKSGKWKSYGTADGLASSIVNSIKETKDNTYWFGTTLGLSRFSKGKWTTFTDKNSSLASSYIYDVLNLTDNTLLIGTNKGVSQYSEGKFHTFSLPKEMEGSNINKIIRAKDGALWFGGNNIAARYMNNQWKIYNLFKDEKNSRILALYESSNGDIWFGSASGIARIKHSTGQVEVFFAGTDFENEMGDIFSIKETRGGEIWFGSLLGLFRYIPGKWKIINDESGIKNTPITYIFQSSKGDYYFGTPRGLLQYHNGNWKLFDDKTGLSNNFIKSVIESKDGTIWVGTLGGGVDHLVHGRWQVYDTKNGLTNNLVYSLLESKDGAIWASTAIGVSKFYNGRWSKFTTADGLAGDQVMSLYQSSDGSIWFGTRSGLSRLYNGHIINYNSSNGLCGNVVQCINGASDGSIWFGTTSSGLSKFDPGKNTWETFNDTTKNALPNNVISQVVEDKYGRLYILTNRGVTRFSRTVWANDNNSNQDEEPGINSIENFSVEDGLPGNEGMVRAEIVDSKGRIWVGTTKGLAYFNPSDEVPDTLPKNILIEKMSVKKFPKDSLIVDGINLNYYQNNISFEYALLSYFKESKTLYRTQLTPYEATPNNWSNNFIKEYTNLPSGKYVFKVWGKDYAGNISGPAEFTFVIKPPFWREPWFLIILFIIFIGIIYYINRLIIAQKLKKQLVLLERQKLLERERSRISQDMHDTVGSSLTRIAILSDRVTGQVQNKAVTEDENSMIQKWTELIGSTAREVIDTMNEIIWSLSPKQDNLESLINYTRHFINSMFEPTEIKYTIEMPEALPYFVLSPDFRRNTFLIIKEIVNNIIKHANASNVSFLLSYKDSYLSFEAADNGVGIKEPMNSDLNKVGFGLKNIKDRAESINAELKIESIPGQGTTIKISIPLHSF